jgi:hypothetical protein
MRVRIQIAYVLIAVTYVATVLSILFGCHPMHKNWQINPNPGSKSPIIRIEMPPYLTEDDRFLPTRRVQN